MKRFRILALLILIASVAALVITCNQSDTAFVTIDLNRPGKSYTHYQPGILQKVDALFSKKAYAMGSVVFPSGKGDLTLTVTSTDLRDITVDIPNDASSFTIEVPAGKQRTFTMLSYTTATSDTSVYTPYNACNFGGHATIDLDAGENVNLIINMIPMTKITSVAGGYITTISFNSGLIGSYSLKYYRSSNPTGPYKNISIPDYGLTSGTYYYRVSMTGISPVTKEGEPSWPPYIFVQP
jgi:hypothetical protein